MIGGAGFSKLAEVINKNNRNLLKRDEPFDKIRSNPFTKKVNWNIRISRKLFEKLESIKKNKADLGRGLRIGLRLFVILFLVFFLMHYFVRF